MDFSFTDEQGLLKRTLVDFVDREVVPLAARTDAEERFPAETFEKLGSLGLLGITVPKTYRGGEGDIFSAALVMEELARGCASTALSWGAHAILCAHNLHAFGDEAQRHRFLPALCSGQRLGAFALTEPNAGSDATSLTTKAEKTKTGYSLTGTKMFITNAPVADVFLVFARTAPTALSLFIVERETPGLSIGAPLEKLGLRGSPTAEVILQHVAVPESNRLGKEGEGIRLMHAALDVERAVFSGVAMGIAQAALDAALKYAKERSQFGRRIGEFQLVQEMLVRIATGVAAGRLLFHRTADAATRGTMMSKDASITKLFTSEMANAATQDALQIFGGWGYIREFPVERFHRDARLTTLGGGTSEIQKLIIAKELLRE